MGGAPAKGGASVNEHSATGGASVKGGTSVRKLKCKGGPLGQARLQQRNIYKSRKSRENKGVLGCYLDIRCFLL